MTTCSDFPSGNNFPNFEMLDTQMASALNKIIQNSQFNKVSLEEQEAQKEDQFLRRRQIAFMIYDYFRVTGAHDTILDHVDLSSVNLRDDDIQEFDTRWDEVPLSVSKIPSGDVLENLYKLRICESDQLKTALDLYDMEIHQKISMPKYQKLKTMAKNSTDQKLRLRNFDARHGRIETGLSGVDGGKGKTMRCTLLNGSAWCTERKQMQRYRGTFDIFFGTEHKMRREEMEVQFIKEAKHGWRFEADAARITDENAGSNLRAVIDEEGAVSSIQVNAGRIAQLRGKCQRRYAGICRIFLEGWTPRNEALMEAMVEQARTTRHPWLMAHDANVDRDNFKKNLWFKEQCMTIAAPEEGTSTCRSVGPKRRSD